LWRKTLLASKNRCRGKVVSGWNAFLCKKCWKSQKAFVIEHAPHGKLFV
jgi:hypothetical protein